MTRAGWFILKWLIIPAGLTAVGYYVVGPRLGNLPIPSSIYPGADTQATKPAEPETKQSNFPSPEVNVKVGALQKGDAEARARRRQRRKRSRPKPPATAAAPVNVVPPVDEGGSGGAATTGGETAGG